MAGRPRWQRATVLTALVAVTATLVTVGVGAARGPRVTTHTQHITVPGGPGDDSRVNLDTTLFVPRGVDARHRAPAVLVAHGFGGSKEDIRADAEELAGHGYVVLTYSARGFGHSTGRIAVDSPDHEVADARRLVDWLARRPEVRLDAPGDPRIGVTGASYGGALSLLLAGYDQRVDAIVPVATWNDLSHAFFPDSTGEHAGRTPAEADQQVDDGVFKRLWAANFFTSGAVPARPAGGTDTTGRPGPPDANGPGQDALCGRFVPEFCHVYQQAARTGRATDAAVALLRRSSPATVLDRIDAPTLLIQGETDSLFPLSEADANARGIARTGTPVRVVWFPGGHDAGAGLADTDRLRSLTTAWFDHYLKGLGSAPARTFEYARITPVNTDTGGPRFRDYVAADYPGLDNQTDATQRRTVTLRGQPQTVLNPAGGAPAAVSGLPGLGDAAGLAGALGGDLPGQSARFDSAAFDRTVDLVGAPTVRVRVSASTDQAVLFAKLYDVDGQGHATLPQRLVAPVRVTGLAPGQTRTVLVTLPAVVHRFEAGHRMRLVLASTDQGYATPADPAAYQVSLVDGRLSVPQVPAARSGRDGSPLPWLVGGALVVAVMAGAAGLTRFGRNRRRGADVDTALAEVPLVIEHLTKSYGDRDARITAVDDLSFRVERGQVLGLLGPNGAGKTTTLRILMGLIHPTAGRVRVFGHAVTPGASVLSRVGSFVEGPGSLPHLSGLDNLRLYWRATGRPAADAHLAEALRIAGLGDAVHRRVRTYSQGMRQRLALAQAMLGLPDLLVLDEPTNGLDPPQIHQMRQVLRDYAAAGRTVLVSSHLLAEVEQTCTHVVVMHRGRLVAAGTVAEIVGDADTVRLAVDDPVQALSVISGLAGARAVSEPDGGLLVTLGRVRRSDLVAGLVQAGVGVNQVVPRRRLEDAFLSLVEEER